MANANRPNGFRAVRKLGGGAIPFYPFMTASNVALAAGDAVVITTAGLISIALAASLQIFGVCQSDVTAVAATQKKVNIIPAMEDTVFVGQSTTWEAAGKKLIGTTIGIDGPTGAMILTNTATQARATVQVLGLAPEIGNVDGNYARMEFIFRKSSFTGQN